MATTKQKYIIGVLFITLFFSGLVYVAFQDAGLKIRVDDDKSTFYVLEDGRWKVSGREYNKLFDGSTKLNRNLGGTYTETFIDNISLTTTIVRTTNYIRGPKIVDTYLFDGTITSVELFPISHIVEIFNGSGYFYRYEVRNLVYDGKSKKIDTSSMSFGRNMKVEWDSGFRWARVYKSGILKVQYDVKSDYEKFNVRLFDPLATSYCYQESANVSTACGGLATGNYILDSRAQNSNDGNLVDGNSGTSITTADFFNDYTFYYMNYTKPARAVEGTLWQVKDGSATINLTITNACWENEATKIVLRLNHSCLDGCAAYQNWDCYNGTTWTNLRSSNVATAFEEGVQWSMTNTSLTLEGVSTNIAVELSSIVNATAETVADEIVCIDVNHPSYGVNYSCGTNSTSFNLIISWFRTTIFNDSTTAKNNTFTTAENKSWYIDGHQYDEVVNLTLGLTGYVSGASYPSNISIYTSDDFHLLLPGILKGTLFGITNFTDTSGGVFFNRTPIVGKWPYESRVGGIHEKTLLLPNVTISNFTINATGTYYLDLVQGLHLNQEYNANHYFGCAQTWGDGLIVIGGANYGTIPLDTTNVTERYDESANTWTQLADFPIEDTLGLTCAIKGDAIYTFGGADMSQSTYYSNAYKYNITTDTWSSITAYPIEISLSGAIDDNTTSDAIYIFGGQNGTANAFKYSWMYNITSNSYTAITDIPEVQGWFSTGLESRDGIIWVFSGRSSSATNSEETYMYNTSDDTYTAKMDMPYRSYGYVHGRVDNIVTVYGGFIPDGTGSWTFGEPVDELHTYNLDTDTWTTHADINPYVGYALGYPSTEIGERIYMVAGYAVQSGFEVGNQLMYLNKYPEASFFTVNIANNDWYQAAEFTDNQLIQMNVTKLNSILSSCTLNTQGLCEVQIFIGSGSSGQINYTINLTYSSADISLDESLVSTYLATQSDATVIPINISSVTAGILQIDNVRYDYAGGNKTYEVKAHDVNYGINTTYNITYYYSDWEYALPSNIFGLDFFPATPTSQDVTPFGQTGASPILNITTTNYGGALNFSIYLNESEPSSCVNLSFPSYSYQEDGNDTATDGTWGAPAANVYDGNWGTGGDCAAGFCNYYVNYTKPSNAVGARIKIEDVSGTTHETISDSCFNAGSKIQIKLTLDATAGAGTNSWWCYNGDSYEFIKENLVNDYVEEEAMNWSIKYVITNNTWIDIQLNQDYESNFGLWLEADYSCNYDTWKLWQPNLYFRTCYEGADVCDTILI